MASTQGTPWLEQCTLAFLTSTLNSEHQRYGSSDVCPQDKTAAQQQRPQEIWSVYRSVMTPLFFAGL